MKTIIISAGRSGGGKTMMARIMSEWCHARGVPVAMVDTDSRGAASKSVASARATILKRSVMDTLITLAEFIEQCEQETILVDTNNHLRFVNDDECSFFQDCAKEIGAVIVGVYSTFNNDPCDLMDGIMSTAHRAMYVMHETMNSNSSSFSWLNSDKAEYRQAWLNAGGREAVLPFFSKAAFMADSDLTFNESIENMSTPDKVQARLWLNEAYAIAAQIKGMAA